MPDVTIEQANSALDTLELLVADYEHRRTVAQDLTTQLSTLQNSYNGLLMENVELRAKLVTAWARIKDLETPMPPYQPPPVVPSAVRIRVGASIADPRLGDLLVQRTYDSGKLGPPTPDRVVVHSFKVWDRATILAWVKAAKTGSAITIWHEPEDNIQAGTLTATQVATWNIELCGIVEECKRVGEVFPFVCVMAWSLKEASGRAQIMKALFTPKLVAALQKTKGFIGYDAYAGKNAANGIDADPVKMFGVCSDHAMSLGLDYAITETGAQQDSTTKGADHAAWWQTAMDLFGSGKVRAPKYFLFWNRVPIDPEKAKLISFAIQDLPEVVTVYKRAVARFTA